MGIWGLPSIISLLAKQSATRTTTILVQGCGTGSARGLQAGAASEECKVHNGYGYNVLGLLSVP
jgi:hypothetical protein